ncbi:YerC/YecD family TrpR-related protein [Paenibacillus sp. N1-5-1-14]|uniref:YerC/YecD family TrpR-related protein n=1 Tax=Paenibacillus radicibacter TaxID=2972488 RepID=UPI002158FBC7|nr:YerC/YecD family TrpR-related protein [Paenibacillus radicibacter]MCR8643979.1 YerC/YecD family TrpR-related protein [Paenibacillus radicibacter]
MLIDELQGKALNDFIQGILSLQTKEECLAFFDDLCTVNEIKTMVQRFQVANMLYNNHTYSEIEDVAIASSATISRVKRSLNHGNHSYKVIFERMNKNQSTKDQED